MTSTHLILNSNQLKYVSHILRLFVHDNPFGMLQSFTGYVIGFPFGQLVLNSNIGENIVNTNVTTFLKRSFVQLNE